MKTLVLLSFFIFGFETYSKVLFKGNKRTQKAFLQDQYKLCVSVFGKAPSEIEQCLLNTRLFSQVKVKQKKKMTVITVVERWTFLPIPFARSDSRERRYGGFFMERNFLGSGKLIVAGGSVGEFTKQYFLLYRDPYFNRNENPIQFRSSMNDNEMVQFNKSSEINGIEVQSSQHSFMLGKRFGLIEASGGLFYGSNKWTPNTKSSNLTALDRSGFGLNVSLLANFSRFRFFYNEGLIFRFSAFHELQSSGSDNLLSQYRLSTAYEYGLSSRLALQFLGQYQGQGNTDRDGVLFLGGGKGLRGVQQFGLWAHQVGSGSVDLMYALSRQSYGTWTLAPFFDYSRYQSFEATGRNWKSTQSYGLGAYLFLNKVALPGLGFIYGKNRDFEGNFFTFFLGRQI